jgi:ribose 5-phosphate isomerase B
MIYIASDHAGFELKNKVNKILQELGFEYEDLGPLEYVKTDDYPDYAFKLAEKVVQNKALGILICDTGIGMDIAANKVEGARASLVTDELQAARAREHNDANIMVLASENIDGDEELRQLLKTWLETEFDSDDRHVRRVNKIIENEK